MRKKLALLATVALVSAAMATAKRPAASARPDDSSPAATEVDVLDLSLDDNLASPDVPRKAQNAIRGYMDQLRRKYDTAGLAATSLRDGEVIMVTMPVSTFFAPMATDLKQGARAKLGFLEPIVREPAKYKVLVAVHTDNTGDDLYADSISGARANAIDDALWLMAGERETNVIPYGMGSESPVNNNATRKGREKNRRVEFYIVPDKGLLQMAGVKIK